MLSLLLSLGARMLGLVDAEKLLDRALDTIDKRADSETDRQRLRAEAIQNHLMLEHDRRRAAMGWKIWWVAWALFAIPLGVWWAHVLLDTAFGFPWDVSDIPFSVRAWADGIYTSIFGSGVGAAAIQSITSAIKGRR